MASQEEALRVWQDILRSKQARTRLKRASTGNGAGVVDVEDKPGFIWVRYEEDQNRLSTVRCLYGFGNNIPVLIGKWHPDDGFEQVLTVNWERYSQNVGESSPAIYTVPAHGETHHGTYGVDPAYIDLNNLTIGRVYASDPESLVVWIETFYYPYGTEIRQYTGGTLDLTASVPGIAGHRMVLVYFDLDTEVVDSADGDIVSEPAIATVPDLEDVNAIPLAAVELENGQTEIYDFYDIWQYKLLLGNIGGAVPPHTHDDDNSGGASLIGVQELMFDCANPLPVFGGQVWPTDVYHELYIQDTGLYTHGGILEAELTRINPDPAWGCGQILIIRPAEPGMYVDYRITVRHGVDNIQLYGERDVVLDDKDDHMIFIYDGENFCDFAYHLSKFGDYKDGNYSEFEDDGTLVAHGDATTWDDLRVALDRGKLTGANQPIFSQFQDDGAGSNGVYAYSFDDDDEIWFSVQLPHTWLEGTTIYPHLHWAASSDVNPTDYLGIGLEYTWTDFGDDFGNTVHLTRIIPTGVNTDSNHQIHNFSNDGIDGTGHSISSVLLCRFYRFAAGVDNYADPIWAFELDFHYQSDTLGSRQILAK